MRENINLTIFLCFHFNKLYLTAGACLDWLPGACATMKKEKKKVSFINQKGFLFINFYLFRLCFLSKIVNVKSTSIKNTLKTKCNNKKQTFYFIVKKVCFCDMN